MARRMTWTDENIELLKTMWAEGKSAAIIAKELGDGATKDSVIGKVHRLNLEKRANVFTVRTDRSRMPKPRRIKNKVASPFNRHWKKERKAMLNTIPECPEPRLVSLLDVKDGECRWPMSDPESGEFRFCGAGSRAESSYCAHHHALAYYPADNKRAAKFKAATGRVLLRAAG